MGCNGHKIAVMKTKSKAVNMRLRNRKKHQKILKDYVKTLKTKTSTFVTQM